MPRKRPEALRELTPAAGMTTPGRQDGETIDLGIGGLCFSLLLDRPSDRIHMHPAYQRFRGDGSHPDVTIEVSYEQPPDLDPADLVPLFDSGALWTLYRRGDGYAITVKAPATGEPRDRVAFFDADFTHGRIYRRPVVTDGLLGNPLENPLFQLLMICLMGRGRGLLVHACGIDDHGRGLLFAGESGAGKSTIAKQFRSRARLLCDDRIVVRRQGRGFVMHGTPWHGDLPDVSPDPVPLERIFFLEREVHRNRSEPRTDVAAAAMLLARSFAPHWSEEQMGFTLETCREIVATVPCATLDFSADESAVEYVRCAV